MTRLLLIVFALFAFDSSGQTPQFYKGLGTSNSTFLFGYPDDSRHSQCIYTNSDLHSPPSGEIFTVYYRYGSTGQTTGNTMYNFRVSFLQITDSAFINANDFYTGTTNVLAVDSFVIPPGTTGDWFAIPLASPYQYDASKTLVVELRYDDVTEQVFGTYGTTNNGRKIISGDSTSASGDYTSLTWQDFGFDQVPVGIEENVKSELNFTVMPVPFSKEITVSISKNVSNATIEMRDVTGKIVFRSEKLSGKYFTFDTREFPAGVYFVNLSGDKYFVTKQVLKTE